MVNPRLEDDVRGGEQLGRSTPGRSSDDIAVEGRLGDVVQLPVQRRRLGGHGQGAQQLPG